MVGKPRFERRCQRAGIGGVWIAPAEGYCRRWPFRCGASRGQFVNVGAAPLSSRRTRRSLVAGADLSASKRGRRTVATARSITKIYNPQREKGPCVRYGDELIFLSR